MPRTSGGSAADTRARILLAARERFSHHGMERTTVRAVAADAGVDPALVVRYFGSKAALFVEAADLDLALPDLTGLAPPAVARALVHRFFEVWEDDPTFLVLLRTAATDETAGDRLRGVFAEQVVPALASVAVDLPERRAALVGSQVIGFAYLRYVLRVQPLVGMGRDDVLAWLGPTLVRYLTEPAPEAGVTRLGP